MHISHPSSTEYPDGVWVRLLRTANRQISLACHMMHPMKKKRFQALGCAISLECTFIFSVQRNCGCVHDEYIG